jgi:hypothetical protein
VRAPDRRYGRFASGGSEGEEARLAPSQISIPRQGAIRPKTTDGL